MHDSSRKNTLYSTPLVFLLPLSATHGAIMGYMELGSCYLWIADPLSGRRPGSRCGTAEKNHELFLGWEGERKVVGWRIRGSLTCPLAADRGEKCRAIYVCISFLRAVVVVLVVSVIILVHFVVVIFSLRMHAQQVF